MRLGPVLLVIWMACVVTGCEQRRTGKRRRSSASFRGIKGVPGRVLPEGLYVETRTAMGTIFRIVVALRPNPEGPEAEAELAAAACRRAFEEIGTIEAMMSDHLPGSEVSRLNRAAAEAFRAGRKGVDPIPLSKDVIVVLQEALQVSRLTRGAFDVTYAALKGPWGMGPEGPTKVASPEQIRRALPFVGYTKMSLDPQAGTVSLRPGMRIDLGGVAKGYALDAASWILRKAGYENHIVYGGGDIVAWGHRPNGHPWRIGVQDPYRRGAYFAILPASNEAVVTSGDYERYILRRGQRYHHILDPRTGRPARGLKSVTVVSNRAVFADALATGLFVMGPEAGRRLVERLPETDAVFVTDSGQVFVTSGLRQRLKIRYQPGANESRVRPGPRGRPITRRPRPRGAGRPRGARPRPSRIPARPRMHRVNPSSRPGTRPSGGSATP